MGEREPRKRSVSGTGLRSSRGAAVAVDWEELCAAHLKVDLLPRRLGARPRDKARSVGRFVHTVVLASRPLSFQFHFPEKCLQVRTLKLC